MVIMSVDLGTKRTGISVCDKNEILAFPVMTIRETVQEKVAEKIIQLIKKNYAELLVIGLPKNMNGTEGKSVRFVFAFCSLLKQKTDIEIIFWDERQTTKSAESYLIQNNIRRKKRKNIIDMVSSTIILQSYLNARAFNKQKSMSNQKALEPV